MNKIQTVFLIDYLSSSHNLAGGTERQLIELIKRLDKDKYSPVLLRLQEYGDGNQIDIADCRTITLGIYKLVSLRSVTSIIKCACLLRKQKTSLLFAYYFDSILVGTVIGLLSGVKAIVSCRRDMGFWYNKKLLFLISCANIFAKRILVNSEAIKSHIPGKERFITNKIDIIPNGVDIEQIKNTPIANIRSEFPTIGSKDVLVGIVSNLNRQVKRVDVFVKAAAIIKDKINNAKFIVVGGGVLESDLRKLAESLGVSDKFVWVGHTPDAIPYIKALNVGVLTSDSEGFPNAIIEYMACKIPVVATNVGGNAELIIHGETGYLSPAGDHESVAENVINFLVNAKLRNSVIIKAIENVKTKYTWNKIVESYDNYCSSLVNKKA